VRHCPVSDDATDPLRADATFDLYAWKSPSDLDDDRADRLLASWREAGGDPSASPFEPSTDVGWFYRELLDEVPNLDVVTDAGPTPTRTPTWLSTTPEPPARMLWMRLPPAGRSDALDSIFGLAAKYDLVLFDGQDRRIHLPLAEMAAHASATFWPGGAIQAAVAGGIGGLIAFVGWALGIAVLSGLFMLIGGFMVAMAIYTFLHEGRKAIKRRRTRAG
jgi:hypothetical protein